MKKDYTPIDLQPPEKNSINIHTTESDSGEVLPRDIKKNFKKLAKKLAPLVN